MFGLGFLRRPHVTAALKRSTNHNECTRALSGCETKLLIGAPQRTVRQSLSWYDKLLQLVALKSAGYGVFLKRYLMYLLFTFIQDLIANF